MDAEMRWHPAACIFPILPDDELQQLADDIKANGQHEPVVIFDGMVLDGRNRWLACKFAGITPKTREFHGSPLDALSYVWSVNVKRRHLSSGQAAIAWAKLEQLNADCKAEVEAMRKEAPKGGRPAKETGTIICPSKTSAERKKDSTDHKLAEAAATNRNYITTARKVVDQAPELAAKVERGEMTLPQAATELRREEKRKDLEQKAQVAKQQALRQDEPLWTLIESDVIAGLESVVMGDQRARLIFADPPYNIGVDYGDHHDDKLDDVQFVEWCLNWTRLACDCLTDDGSLWLMINDEYAADFVTNARDCGLTMRAWIKWYETFGVNCSNNFNRTSRHILYFVLDPDCFVFNETEVLRPSDRQTKYGDQRAQSSGKTLDDVWQIPRLSGTSAERIPDFPTQLPLELVSRIVRVASEPGDLILDPFSGSATTGVAAIQHDRKYIGIDASSRFIEASEKRLAAAQYDV